MITTNAEEAKINLANIDCVHPVPEMETGRVDRHLSGRPAGRVAGRVEILRPAGQVG